MATTRTGTSNRTGTSAGTSTRSGGRDGAGQALTHPDKVLIGPDVTKAELAAYHRAAAPRMVPELRGRPLMLEMHPSGPDAQPFMLKRVPEHYPDWVHRATVPKEGGELTQVLAEDARTLEYLVNQGMTTAHRWLSRADRPRNPDRLVIDLDPSGEGSGQRSFAPVRRAARWTRALLDEIGLPAVLMTTGSRGLHVIVPLDRRADSDAVLDFARRFADALAARHPDDLTTAPRKQARGDRLYLDVARNGYAQTAVAPYAVRARPGGPVAVPLDWSELDDDALTAGRWTLRDDSLAARLEGPDPWEGAFAHPHGLGPAGEALDSLD